MLNVGLTGGIGSGKSAVARRLAEHGAVVIDSDVIAREVVAPGTDGLREIVDAFGTGVLQADGSLDRPALGAVVFGDPDARHRLEAITHPRVRGRSRELAAAAAPDAVVVNDVPLLVEVGLAATYHLVLVVETDRDIRIRRLVRDRGMTERQALDRIAAQADDDRRRAAADVLLRNDADLADLHAAVDGLWRERLLPYEANVRQRRRAVRPVRAALAEPDPSWPDQARRVADRIRHLVGDPGRRIDHIGSTAVPGLPAKDVVDLQLSVSSLAEADGFADRLAAGGFPRPDGEWYDSPKPPDLDPAAWRKRLHVNADPGRPVNLHVRVTGSPGWRCALLLRDFLRADEQARAEYLALKRQLAERAATTDEYADAKEPWFDRAYERAQRWAGGTGWQP